MSWKDLKPHWKGAIIGAIYGMISSLGFITSFVFDLSSLEPFITIFYFIFVMPATFLSMIFKLILSMFGLMSILDNNIIWALSTVLFMAIWGFLFGKLYNFMINRKFLRGKKYLMGIIIILGLIIIVIIIRSIFRSALR